MKKIKKASKTYECPMCGRVFIESEGFVNFDKTKIYMSCEHCNISIAFDKETGERLKWSF